MDIAELIIGLILDVFGSFLMELIGELFFRKIDSNSSKVRSTFHNICICLFIATLLGGFSLSLVRNHFIKSPDLRLLSFIVSPVLLGLTMGLRGKLLRRKGKIAIKLDSFGYGWLFAFTYLGIRFVFGKS